MAYPVYYNVETGSLELRRAVHSYEYAMLYVDRGRSDVEAMYRVVLMGSWHEAYIRSYWNVHGRPTP